MDFSDPGNNFDFASGDGTLAGSFLYDAATNVYSDINLVGVDTDTAGSFDQPFFLGAGNATNVRFQEIETGDRSGGLAVSLVFLDPLTDAGGTARLNSLFLGLCNNASCNMIGAQDVLQTAGNPVDGFEVTGTPVPLPAGLPLLLMGLAALGLYSRPRA